MSLTPNYPFIKHSCMGCKQCWLNLETGYCICGGPFTGYKDAEGRPIDIGALPEKRENDGNIC